jgi:hypothetical protein
MLPAPRIREPGARRFGFGVRGGGRAGGREESGKAFYEKRPDAHEARADDCGVGFDV